MVRERVLKESLDITPEDHLLTWHKHEAGGKWGKTWAKESLGIYPSLCPMSLLSTHSQIVSNSQKTCLDILFSRYYQALLFLCWLLTLSMPAGNPATTAKHDWEAEVPHSPPNPWLYTACPLTIHMTEVALWSFLPLRPVGSSSGLSLWLTTTSYHFVALFCVRGQQFPTLDASSGLIKVSTEPDYEIFPSLWV